MDRSESHNFTAVKIPVYTNRTASVERALLRGMIVCGLVLAGCLAVWWLI